MVVGFGVKMGSMSMTKDDWFPNQCEEIACMLRSFAWFYNAILEGDLELIRVKVEFIWIECDMACDL